MNTEEWKIMFKGIQRAFPSKLARALRPRVVFLPDYRRLKWRKIRYGSFNLLNVVFLGSGLNDAPEFVRPWVLGHEYGHVVHGHGLLILVCLLLLVGSLFSETPLFFVMAGLAAFIVFSPLGEYQADDVAVKVCGSQEAALRGSLWMAEMNGTMGQSVRQKRLCRLGWDGKSTWRDVGADRVVRAESAD